MAAYGAVVRLLDTLFELHTDPNCPFPQIAELIVRVYSLKFFLVENREVKSQFETLIREAIYEAQDIIDSYTRSIHFLSEISSKSSTHFLSKISSKSFCDDLERVKQEITLFAVMTSEECNHLTLDRIISTSVWRDAGEINCTKKYRLIGRDKDVYELKDRLIKGTDGLEVVSIVGIAGIGKTALARCLLEDSSIDNHFAVRGCVKLSVKYTKHDILLDILASMRKFSMGIRLDQLREHHYNWSDEILQKTDVELTKYLYNLLKDKRYIFLLDDIHNVEAWDDLKELFPNNYNGSRILLTTWYEDVAPARPHVLDYLSDEDTLSLLEEIVFDGESCPANLVSIAKDIASSCRGFPHAVVIVGRLLLCANLCEEYWEMVLSSIVACENCADLIEALLSLTYNHLPQRLKVCLLYVAIFPYNYDCFVRKLNFQWIVEGFMEQVTDFESMLGIAWMSIHELLSRGFFFVCLKGRDFWNGSMRIADEVFHDFLVRKAQEEKFFFVINRDTSCSLMQGGNIINQQRRLCIQQNIHHAIKALSACNLNSSARSFIYAGPDHPYRLRAWSENFELLEVLDALKIGFYTFPPEIPKLVQLKYLAFSYNGQISATLCNLRNLQVLIISDHLNLRCYGVPSYLPVEIWNLRDLVHLQVVGYDLPEPPPGSNLEKLDQLIDVSARSCTRNILERIKKLEILEVRIESSSEDEAFSFFSYLNLLHDLFEFKCFVTYPDIGSRALHSSILAFPSTLHQLTLRGCGFPWEYMTSVATLPNLVCLKLQTYAFKGSDWEVKENEFPKLESLWLEDMGFENWTIASNTAGSSFPSLECLIIRHCYKLQCIPSVFADSPAFEMLEVVDCSTSAMNSALQIKQEILKRPGGSNPILFDIFSSKDM